MDSGTAENTEKSFNILMKVLKNENERNYDADNRRAVRVALHAYYMSKFNFEEAEKYISDSIQYINTLDLRGKEDYYAVLDRLYTLHVHLGYGYEAIKSMEKAVKDAEKDLGKNHIIVAGLLNNLLENYLMTIPSQNDAKRVKTKLENILEETGDFLDKHNYYAALGNYYLMTKDFKKAEINLDKSFKISNIIANTPSLIVAKIKMKKYDEAKKIIDLYKPFSTNDQNNFLNAKFILYYDTKNIDELKKVFVEKYLFYSNYSKGILIDKGNPDIEYYNSRISSSISLLANLNENDLNKISEYFEKKLKQNFNSAIIELLELSRASKFNKRVQNLIDRSNNKNIEKDKRILQDLLIEYENIPRFANSKNEREKI